jgi:hypothetical protein
MSKPEKLSGKQEYGKGRETLRFLREEIDG